MKVIFRVFYFFYMNIDIFIYLGVKKFNGMFKLFYEINIRKLRKGMIILCGECVYLIFCCEKVMLEG